MSIDSELKANTFDKHEREKLEARRREIAEEMRSLSEEDEKDSRRQGPLDTDADRLFSPISDKIKADIKMISKLEVMSKYDDQAVVEGIQGQLITQFREHVASVARMLDEKGYVTKKEFDEQLMEQQQNRGMTQGRK